MSRIQLPPGAQRGAVMMQMSVERLDQDNRPLHNPVTAAVSSPDGVKMLVVDGASKLEVGAMQIAAVLAGELWRHKNAATETHDHNFTHFDGVALADIAVPLAQAVISRCRVEELPQNGKHDAG